MTDENEAPDYLKNYGNDIDDSFWSNLKQQLDWFSVDIVAIHQETLHDAVSKKPTEFLDPDNGATFTPESYVPFIDGLDYDYFDSSVERAITVVPNLINATQKKEMNPRLFHDWATLKAGIEVIELLKSSKTGDLRSYRINYTRQKSKNHRKIWVSKCLVALMAKNMSRADAQTKLFLHVKSLLQTKNYPAGFDEEFFFKMVTMNESDIPTDFKSTYKSDGHLPNAEVIRLAEDPDQEIPPLL